MTIIEQSVHKFLTHRAIKKSWVAEQLYGENTKATRAELSNKLKGTQGRYFSAEELDKLDQLRRSLINDLI
ncbi:hypothetical protein [Spirosoma foliorum]|uniref:Uncharacterized protein n=1 Tax=Spirosoma foliorum TaxID=2710596 RepID=A0A7G5H2E9_9BACT|nr:hypothetical protein [Spirosoma foliorum]QMW05291.1 hypothetical protein H3H32_10600 [Spirosoma foliorum]